MHCVNTRILINAKIVWVKGMIDIYKAFRNARARTEYFKINACMYDFKPLYNRPLPSLSNSHSLSVTSEAWSQPSAGLLNFLAYSASHTFV